MGEASQDAADFVCTYAGTIAYGLLVRSPELAPGEPTTAPTMAAVDGTFAEPTTVLPALPAKSVDKTPKRSRLPDERRLRLKLESSFSLALEQ